MEPPHPPLGSVLHGWEHVFVYRRYSERDFDSIQALARRGLSDYEIARRTGIPRSTVQNLRVRSEAPRRGRGREMKPSASVREGWGAEYAYLLGIYLGDGHVWRTGASTYRLAVYCDAAYPEIVAEIRSVISSCVPEARSRVNRKSENCLVVLASSPVWPLAFPQHGPGRKHERPIVLEPWQSEITRRHPEALLRGLIHSDGCRCVNRFRTRLPSGRVAEYGYPRYFFSNLSSDIRRIFCDHCDLLGIRWTQSNERNISVAHRPSVELLDGFVGPKR